MIKLGNNDITLKVGSNDVSAAYLGSTLVYTSTPPSFNGKWLATYTGGTTSSAECDASSAITQNEISLTDLVSVEIGDCVTSINPRAFSGYTSLTSVTIPDSVTTIGANAFRSCSGLTSMTIPDSVTTLGIGVFLDCSGLTSINIPSGVTTIEGSMYKNCVSLSSITIPDSVTTIGAGAFENCTSLPVENNIRYADTYAAMAVDKTKQTYVIKNGTRFIGDSAFTNCNNASSITIPDSVTTIGANAFRSCSGLTSINIPSGVTNIGVYTFQGCSSLTSIEIPSGVTSIGNYAFRHCSGLTSITCLATTPPSLGGYIDAFDDTNNCPIYVPAASVDTYKSASAWSTYASRIQAIPEPSPQWVDYASGEIIPTDLDIYGVSGTSASLCNTFPYTDNTIYFHLERNAVIADIGPGCYSGSYPMSGDIEITFSDVVDAGCPDSYRLGNAVNVATGVKLLIYQ